MTLDSIRASVTLDPIRETNVWQKLFRLLPRYDAAFAEVFVKCTLSKAALTTGALGRMN